jgi:hypothetical protein
MRDSDNDPLRQAAGKLPNHTVKTSRWQGHDGVNTVVMVEDWTCAVCFRTLRPSAVRLDAVGAVLVTCEACHFDLLKIEL